MRFIDLLCDGGAEPARTANSCHRLAFFSVFHLCRTARDDQSLMRRRLIATRQTTNAGFHFEPKHEISTRTGGPIRYLASRRCPTMTPTDGAEYFRNPRSSEPQPHATTSSKWTRKGYKCLPTNQRTENPDGHRSISIAGSTKYRSSILTKDTSDGISHSVMTLILQFTTARKCLNHHSHAGGALDYPFLLRRWGQVHLLPRLSIRQEYHSLIIRSHKKSARKKQTTI